MLFFFLIFLLRLVVRNEWLAAGAFVLLFSTMQALREEYFWVALIVFIIIYSLAAIALVRFGLVSLASAREPPFLLTCLPLSLLLLAR